MPKYQVMWNLQIYFEIEAKTENEAENKVSALLDKPRYKKAVEALERLSEVDEVFDPRPVADEV